jgi:flagellar M-ring protein FliF
MDSPANSLINPDARGLASTPGAAAPAAGGVAGAAADLGGSFGPRLSFPGSLTQMRGNPRAPLIFALAILIAVVAGLVMWMQKPDYKVLYSNLSDRDGGAIIAALQQQNIPYKFSDGGGAILVPADQVHETRLRLATQGLPKSGSVGFELMDNQKFGISQFAEQINYQRALEGELEQTIEAISSVKTARVHLAIPKPSVFVRDKEAPTASVLVDLNPGRMLDDGQVSAITHMVASAVSDLPVHNVTIVDQDGNLLTQATNGSGLDASQLKYVQEVEHATQQRVDAILAPIFGAGNAHSQVSADVDFSKIEQTAESYDPNGTPQNAAIRSQQTSSSTEMATGGAGGVPGALSNQPPQPASAPVDAASGASGVSATPVNDHRDMTTNYELDRTVRHTQQGAGGIKRLSVAVVVNYVPQADGKGHSTMQPVPQEEIAKVEQLVKDAMGFDAKRGDTVYVMNSAFKSNADVTPDVPWWRTPEMISYAMQAGRYLGIFVVALFLYFAMVRPAMRRAFPPPPEPVPAIASADDEPLLLDGLPPAADRKSDALEDGSEDNPLLAFESERNKFERNLEFARTIARQDPKIVATVVKNWVSDER